MMERANKAYIYQFEILYALPLHVSLTNVSFSVFVISKLYSLISRNFFLRLRLRLRTLVNMGTNANWHDSCLIF